MKVGGSVIKFGLAIVILLAAGCDKVNFKLVSGNDPVKTGTPPFAVLSMAPTQECFAKLLSFTKNSDEPTSLSEKQLHKLFPGIDICRPAAAFLYLSSKGVAEPLIYVPVDDYERFLDELDRRFPMKRAIASSFKCGRYQLMVMRVGEYAAIGSSLQGIKKGPRPPEAYLQELPQDFDFVFKWHPGSTNKREKMKLVRSIRGSFGEAFSQLVSKSESLVCGLKVDSTRKIEFHAEISPVKEKSLEIQTLMNNMFAAQGWTASTEIRNHQLVYDVAFSSDQANSTWARIQPAVTNYFKSKRSVMANRSSSSGPFGLPGIMTSGSGGATLPGGSSGSPGCSTTRRG